MQKLYKKSISFDAKKKIRCKMRKGQAKNYTGSTAGVLWFCNKKKSLHWMTST